MVDFVGFIYKMGYALWSALVDLGYSFSNTSSIITENGRTTISGIFNSFGNNVAITSQNNPFYQVLIDYFGTSEFNLFYEVLSVCSSALSKLFNVVRNLVNALLAIISALFNVSFEVPNIMILIFYFIISVGSAYIFIKLISRVIKTIIDLIPTK